MSWTSRITQTPPVAACALALLLVLPAVAGADDGAEEGAAAKRWGVQVATDSASAYWFRGIDVLAKDPVLVPHATATFGSFSAYWWGYKENAGEDRTDYFENDFGLDYTFSPIDVLSLTLGALTYTYVDPEDVADTTEVYAVAALHGPLSPKLSLYYDVDLYDAGYASLGVSHGFALREGLTLTPSATYGQNLEWTEKALASTRSPTTQPNDLLLGADFAWTRGSLGLHATAQRSIALAALEALGQEDFSIYTLGGSYSF
jgi:hypothetical protein